MSEPKPGQSGVNMQRTALWIAAVGSAVLLTACSSSNSGTALTPTPPATLATQPAPSDSPVATLTPSQLRPESVGPSPSSPSPRSAAPVPAPTPTQDEDPTRPEKSKKPKPTAAASNCDPNYANACVPIVAWDLDCGDIGEMVFVVDQDIHGFDADGDGRGCESYG